MSGDFMLKLYQILSSYFINFERCWNYLTPALWALLENNNVQLVAHFPYFHLLSNRCNKVDFVIHCISSALLDNPYTGCGCPILKHFATTSMIRFDITMQKEKSQCKDIQPATCFMGKRHYGVNCVCPIFTLHNYYLEQKVAQQILQMTFH